MGTQHFQNLLMVVHVDVGTVSRVRVMTLSER